MIHRRTNKYAGVSLALVLALGITGCAQTPFSQSPELEESETDEEEGSKETAEVEDDQEESDDDKADKGKAASDKDKADEDNESSDKDTPDKGESDDDKDKSEKDKSKKSKKSDEDDDNGKKGSSLSKDSDSDEDGDDESDDDELIASEDDDFDYDEWMDHATTHEEGDFFQKMFYGDRYIDGIYTNVTDEQAVDIMYDMSDMTYHWDENIMDDISDMPTVITGISAKKVYDTDSLEQDRERLYEDNDEDDAAQYYSNLLHLAQLDTVYLSFARRPSKSSSSYHSAMRSYLCKFEGDEVIFAGFSYDYSTFEIELDDEEDWLRYDISLAEGGVELSSDDFSLVYKTYNRLRCDSGLADSAYCFGYAWDMSGAYENINNLSFDYASYDAGKHVSDTTEVYFGRDSSNNDSSAKITTDGDEFTISLTKSYKNGKMVKDEHEIKGRFLDCGATMLLLLIDGVWYDYTGDVTDFYAVYDNVETSDSLSDDQVAAINEKRSGVIDELEKVLGDLNCTIDESTGTIMLDNSVLFEFDSYELSAEGKEVLDDFMAIYIPVILNQIDEGNITSLEISGFTDSTGADGYNQTLSEKRAATVAEYVISRYPELEDYVMSAGYGENYLIYNSDGTEDAEASRRVEFTFNIAVD